jgi:hypothetical protein
LVRIANSIATIRIKNEEMRASFMDGLRACD